MADSCDETLSTQLAAFKLQLASLNTAIAKVAVDGMASYQFDSGQTRHLVTRLNLTSMREHAAWLFNQVTMLESMLCRTGSTHVVPGF